MTGMYLEHYGVLGMKWGVRKSATQAERKSAATKAQEKLKRLDAVANKKRREG